MTNWPTKSPANGSVLGVLEGACLDWSAAAIASQELLALADFHGIQPLLGEALENTPSQDWPAHWQHSPWQETLSTLISAWQRERARELFRRQELSYLLDTLIDHGIQPVILKGTALAYEYYPHPALRPRCDTDLLVAPGTQQRAIQLLEARGYQRAKIEPQGSRLSYQTALYRRDEDGVQHALDLHWRISNRQALANTLDHASLVAHSQTLQTLGDSARIPCREHLLLHAALHRAAHLRERTEIAAQQQCSGNRLLWLYDIHLLATGLTTEAWQTLHNEAATRGLSKVLGDVLQHCQRILGTPVPETLLTALQTTTGEASAAYLFSSPVQHLLADFRALNWWGRGQLAGEMLFPPASQLRQRSPGGAPLPLLYLHRLLRGTCKLWQREQRAKR